MEPVIGQLGSFVQKFGLASPDPSVYLIYDEIIQSLHELGLSAKEAKILLYLIIRKHATATEISRHSDIGRTETYNYITGLMRMGVVFSTFDRPQKYYALPLDKTMEQLIAARRTVLQRISDSTPEYHRMLERLSSTMALTSIKDEESYQILSGENSLISTVKRMVAEAKQELVVLVGEKTFVSLYHAGIVDDLVQLAGKGIHVRLMTSCRNVSQYIAQGAGKEKLSVTQIAGEAMVDFTLVDNKDVVVILASGKEKSKSHGFYTNNPSIINVFRTFFEKTK